MAIKPGAIHAAARLMRAARNNLHLRDFFAGRPDTGPPSTPTGEFLVEQKLVTRYQLFQALQLQDHLPNLRLGKCLSELGFVQEAAVENALALRKALDELERESEREKTN